MSTLTTKLRSLAGLTVLAAAAYTFTTPVKAQDKAFIARGDAVVTGFSGAKAAGIAKDGEDASDEVFIDLDGPSMQILPLAAEVPPAGQLLQGTPLAQIKARDIGQVFAVTLDDGLKPQVTGVTPNIYLGATSAFGLQIVIPDADGDGSPERVKKGHPNAEWMAGQFGPGGGPGSIWKIDGTTGTASQFATLPGNAGPGVGDIVFDSASLHFYASDLDTGLIHRIDSAGNPIDTFDHGVKGREAAGLSAIADDGAVLDIKSPDFDALDPKTWRMADPERRIYGLGLSGGRLYYAVAKGPEIWSVSLKLDGSFGADARREFEVSGTPASNPITDIAFDSQGLMVLAQRGTPRGSYDYVSFAEAKSSVVFRYRREIPDDPATPGIWVPVPDEFAIGFPPDHRNTAGGVALGYGYDENGRMRTGACGAMLWSTGDNLRDGAGDGPGNVHGLQGVDRMLVRPDNEPPAKSYFLDYDGRFDDPMKSGQVGDVEIWQPCDQASFGLGPYAPFPYLPPNYVPPGFDLPGYLPPGEPPVWGWDYNLHIDKAAVPFACAPGGLGFLCTYTVRVTNFGPDPFIGPVVVHDTLPAAPAGATMAFDNQPPWVCVPASPTDYTCTYDPAVLWPGSSIDLKVTVDMPAPPPPVCHLDNTAHLAWPFGFADSNPGDDFAWATSGIPAGHCPPVAGEKTNLKLSKIAWNPICTNKLGHFECDYAVQVLNAGGATYNGDIKIDELIPAGTTPTFFIGGTGSCTNAAPYSCTFANEVLNPGATRVFGVRLNVPNNLADDLSCQATNKAKIVEYPGGHDLNTDPTDDEAEATATIPGSAAQCPGLKLSNLKIKKKNVTGGPCQASGGKWECKFTITLQNFGKTMQNPVSFLDTLTMKPGTIEFQTPGNWQCQAWNFPNMYRCQSDNPNLGMGDSVDIQATVKIPLGETQQCQIKNKVAIIGPIGGSPQNSFGGDDASSALAQLAPVFPLNGNPYCLAAQMQKPDKPLTDPKKQETNLSISKTAGASTATPTGQNTPFVITVTNTGPGVYNGPIVVRETLPVEPANGSWSDPWTCEGQSMAGHPEQGLCTHPGVTLQPGESVVLDMEMEMPNSYVAPSGSNVTCGYTNQVEIVEAAGGTPANTNAGDDTATAQVHFAPFEKHGQTFCGIDDFVPPPPPPPSCPQGWSKTPVAGKCCPPRTYWNGQRCTKGDPPDTCKPKSCDRDQVFDVGVCRCVDLQCPSDTVGKYPNCRPIVDDDCPSGFTGTPPHCRRIIVDPPRRCPPNSDDRFAYPDCRCEKGFVGEPPNCRRVSIDPGPGDSCKPKACGRGKTWDSEGCACVEKGCPEGTIGKYPNCRPKECPSGFTGTPPNCKPKECPSGTVGKYPNCRKLPTTCGPGFKGTPPNCTKIVVDPPKCPDGYSGRPPRCRKDPPPQCPKGFTGTPPNCKRVVIDPPRCPPGMIGKPPRCHRPPPPKCPPGTVGTPPRCKPVAVPRPQQNLTKPARPISARPLPAPPPRIGPAIRR